MSRYHVLILHPRDMNSETVEKYTRRVSTLIDSMLSIMKSDQLYDVTASRDDWEVYGRSNGDYDKWIVGLDGRYDAAVCITPEMGKATARILHLFQLKGRSICLLTSTGLSPIKEVRAWNENNWKEGWEAVI